MAEGFYPTKTESNYEFPQRADLQATRWEKRNRIVVLHLLDGWFISKA